MTHMHAHAEWEVKEGNTCQGMPSPSRSAKGGSTSQHHAVCGVLALQQPRKATCITGCNGRVTQIPAAACAQAAEERALAGRCGNPMCSRSFDYNKHNRYRFRYDAQVRPRAPCGQAGCWCVQPRAE